MYKSLFLLLAAWLSVACRPAQAQTLSPLGVWTNAEKKATFEIYKCGDKLCGKIVTLTIPNDPYFGVLDTGAQWFAPKILPATGKVDVNRIYFFKLPTPLR